MGVKLIMEEKEGPKVIIGISNDNCDPIIETVEGYIEDAMGKAYRLLRKAETQWNTNPRYPKYERPKEPKQKKAEKKPDKNVTKPDKNVTETVTSESEAKESVNVTASVAPELPLLAEESKPEKKCRVCGCTQNNPCEGGCYWVEEDLCSACVDKVERKTGLFLQDGRGPFESVQEALDAYGAPKDTRPHHNRYDRLSRAWQQVIIRKV